MSRVVHLVFSDPLSQEETREEISDSAHLERRLGEVRDHFGSRLDHAIGVDLTDEDRSLSVGLGEEFWALIQSTNDYDEFEQWCSLGDGDAEGSVVYYMPQWTDIPRKWLVPRSLGLEAVKEWYETGKLSSAIEWTDESY